MKAKSRRYFECIQIMQYLARQRLTNQCLKNNLTTAIVVMKGGDPRTIKSWLNSLKVFGMISFHKVNPSIVNLHFEKVPEALPDLVKSGQKRLL